VDDANDVINYSSCSGGGLTLTYTFNTGTGPACAQISNVVDSFGQNKAWVGRVVKGSDYSLTCNVNMPSSFTSYVTNAIDPTKTDTYNTAVNPISPKNCTSTSATPPFGSANPPAGDLAFISNPPDWTNPLPYFSPTSDAAKTNGSMGQLYDQGTLSNLFAQSYGIWNWVPGVGYMEDYKADWQSRDLPWCGSIANNIGNNSRPASGVACAVAPEIPGSMTMNGMNSPDIYGRGFVNLTFNSQIDSQQGPMTEYAIDWGDGAASRLDVSGADMSPRPLGTPPHSVYHAYDYYDLLNKYNSMQSGKTPKTEMPTLVCPLNKDYCTVKPRVKIVDNWGWCTEGRTGNPCPQSNQGVCMNSKRETSGSACNSNYSSQKNTVKPCQTSAYSICSDGWWETTGQVIIHNQY
jgi:hypothetical protein